MKVCSTVRETTKIDATTSAAVIPTAKPTPASRRVMNRLSMMPERASADLGPENRYSQTSAGVFPTRGPTWGKALRKTTQMTSSSAEAMAIGARNLNVPRTAVISVLPERSSTG